MKELRHFIAFRKAALLAIAASLILITNEQEKLRAVTGNNETPIATRRLQARKGQVKTGIDILEACNFEIFKIPPGKKKRIGLVTNQTGMDSLGHRTIDVLAHAPGVELAAIFTPEHGAAGVLDSTDISNTKDAVTGVPVYSVYGDTDARRRPPALKNMDAVVYDIQDVGSRFYTYETTLGYFLEAAKKSGIEMYVLDRPNPITGSFVQGAISEAGRESFVNYHPVPVRHGMTIGELAILFNAERNIYARLTVVKMEGWQRGDWYDSTGLAWINPSPNMRSLTEATLYPGVGLIEGTNVSVGRGTDTPFEVVGAPWIKSRKFSEYLNARQISGVRFVPANFTPTANRYEKQSCGGVNIVVTDRISLDSPGLGIELASALHKLYPNDYKVERIIELLANQSVVNSIVSGEDPRRIAENWRASLERFQEMRKKYLIY